jgi:hypothetical protein
VNDFLRVFEAVLEFNDMTPDERSRYYDEFFEDWDLDADEESLFWDLYRES